MEARVESLNPIGGRGSGLVAVEAAILRIHVRYDMFIEGSTRHIDPEMGWLFTKFTHYYGHARNLHPSRLANAWDVPAVPADRKLALLESLVLGMANWLVLYDRSMSMISLARSERTDLCDLMLEMGPDAPTVPDGWSVLDLAAHLVVRERDVWAAPGIVLGGPFKVLLEAAMRRRRRHGLEGLVDTIRTGPPRWWRYLPAGAQLSEYYIHHEDIRRANGHQPRTGTRELDEGLARLVTAMAPRVLRTVEAGLDLTWHGGVLYRHGSEPRAILEGPPGELLLYLTGRRQIAEVGMGGDETARGVLENADLTL